MNSDKHRSTDGARKPSRSRFRLFVVWGVASIAVLIIAVLLFDLVRPEPTWNGRRLSSYLSDLRPERQQSRASQDHAEVAVRTIGDKSIPFLLTWMNSDDNLVKKVIYGNLPRSLKLRWDPEWAFDRQWMAATAFVVLGTNAESAIPKLSNLLGTGKRGQPAAAALAGIGDPAFTVLTNLFLQEGAANDAAYGLTRFGDLALPTFIRALANTNQTVHRSAFVGLRFCMDTQYIWKDPNPSRSSLVFNTTAIRVATAIHAGREKALLARTLDDCAGRTNQEVVAAAKSMKTQLGL